MISGGIIIVAIFALITMLLIVEGAILGDITMLTVGLFLAGALIVVAYQYYTQESPKAKKTFAEKQRVQNENVDFRSGKTTPTLKKRSAISGRCFYINQYFDVDFVYNPEKITYTSVTIGGITTGGVNKTDAHYSTTSPKPTGKYMLMSDKVEIKEIILTDKLLREAKSDPNINKYIVENRIVLRNSTKHLEEAALKNAYLNNNLIALNSMTKDSIINSKLTKDECMYIKNWIYGDEA